MGRGKEIHIRAGIRNRQRKGRKRREEVDLKKERWKGEQAGEKGRTPRAGQGSSTRTHHFLNDRLRLGGLQLLFHLLLH